MPKLAGFLAAVVLAAVLAAVPRPAAAELPCKALKDIALAHASLNSWSTVAGGDPKGCHVPTSSPPPPPARRGRGG
jgi:hypothetical protein